MKVRQGNFALFAELVRPYQRLIFVEMMAFRHSQAEAEELTQETLATALAKLHQLRDVTKFRSWIVQIAYNLAKMRARRERTLVFKSLEELGSKTQQQQVQQMADRSSLPTGGFTKPELREAIVSALEGLTSLSRQIFFLRYVEGVSIAETAAMLGISSACVKARSRRARLQLQKALIDVHAVRRGPRTITKIILHSLATLDNVNHAVGCRLLGFRKGRVFS